MATSSSLSLANAINLGLSLLSPCCDTAKLDAQILLAFVLNKPSSYLLTWPEQLLSVEQYQCYNALLQRRLQGEPVAYLTGVREFWSLPFAVSPATLIPRADTETLVESVLLNFQQQHLRCLDLGTGTGAIALALQSERADWQIDAIDFNSDVVALAQRNALTLNLAQVTIYQSDWFAGISTEQQFDVIVSNPPYIDDADEHLLQGDVRFEPRSALVAADNGLADMVLIATQARQYLSDTGGLFFEHGYQQAPAVREILESLGYVGVTSIRDLSGHERVTWARYSTGQAERPIASI